MKSRAGKYDTQISENREDTDMKKNIKEHQHSSKKKYEKRYAPTNTKRDISEIETNRRKPEK